MAGAAMMFLPLVGNQRLPFRHRWPFIRRAAWLLWQAVSGRYPPVVHLGVPVGPDVYARMAGLVPRETTACSGPDAEVDARNRLHRALEVALKRRGAPDRGMN